jgi:hypothetical protein
METDRGEKTERRGRRQREIDREERKESRQRGRDREERHTRDRATETEGNR